MAHLHKAKSRAVCGTILMYHLQSAWMEQLEKYEAVLLADKSTEADEEWLCDRYIAYETKDFGWIWSKMIEGERKLVLRF